MQLAAQRRAAGGFTLIELGIVIGVTAILSATFLPDFLEAARTRLTERTLEEVSLVQDVASWYYSNKRMGSGVLSPAWPGQAGTLCQAVSDPLQELFSSGYYGRNRPKNPWDRPYVASLEVPTGSVDGCLFKLSTLIPEQLAGYFSGRVKQGGCGRDACGPTPAALNTPSLTAGFIHCCAFAAQPSTGVVAGCKPPRQLRQQGNEVVCN